MTKKWENKKLQFTPQAVGSIMMCVQRGLMSVASDRPAEECDITKLLLGLEMEQSLDGKLLVLNPPMLEVETE